uniref:Muscle-restricted coiled-coil protein n=1 Tax=Apteryx owenii TaxID=8824 RepID=A0A8B9QB23_APTOW
KEKEKIRDLAKIILRAFSRENIQKTRQNFGKKVNRLRTRIVTPERRERIRQSGERLKQSGIRFKKTISQEGIQEGGVHVASATAAAEPFTEEISYTEVTTKIKKDKISETKGDSESAEKGEAIPEISFKQEGKEGGGGGDNVPLLDLKQSA